MGTKQELISCSVPDFLRDKSGICHFRSASQVNFFRHPRMRNQAEIPHTSASIRSSHPFTSRTPENCPAMRSIRGRMRNAAFCCDSSMVCAFAEPFTMRVMAIRETAGESRNSMISQLNDGTVRAPNSTNSSVSINASITRKDRRETIMLMRKDAMILA